MKIQDLINELEKLKCEYGNVEIKVENADEYSNYIQHLDDFELEIREDNIGIFILISH